MGDFFHSYVSHNQRVYPFMTWRLDTNSQSIYVTQLTGRISPMAPDAWSPLSGCLDCTFPAWSPISKSPSSQPLEMERYHKISQVEDSRYSKHSSPSGVGVGIRGQHWEHHLLISLTWKTSHSWNDCCQQLVVVRWGRSFSSLWIPLAFHSFQGPTAHWWNNRRKYRNYCSEGGRVTQVPSSNTVILQ